MNTRRQFSAMFAAHLKMMFREKQVWFWNLFFPIILMVLFMLIFGGGSGSSFSATIAVVKPQANAAADGLEGQLRQIPLLKWKTEQPISMEQAEQWIKDKDIDAIVVLPESSANSSLTLIVNTENEGGASTQAITGIMDKMVQQANFSIAGVKPTLQLETKSISAGSENLNYVDFLLTGMIALAIAQGGLFGMVDLVEMRRTGLLRRLRMTPVRIGLFGLASMLVRFILGVVQIVILALIGVFAFGANLHLDLLTLVVAFLFGSLAFNAIGYLFSSFSKSIEAYMGVANIASFLMMFLSGIFIATSVLPGWLQSVSQVLPLTYFVNGLRDGMVYGSGIATGDFWIGIAILSAWGLIAYIIGATIYRKGKIAAR